MLFAATAEDQLFEAVEQKKTEHQRDHCTGGTERIFTGKIKDLWDNDEADDAQEHAGAEAKNEMQLLVKPQRKEPPPASVDTKVTNDSRTVLMYSCSSAKSC